MIEKMTVQEVGVDAGLIIIQIWIGLKINQDINLKID